MAINLKLPKKEKSNKIKKGNIPKKNYINIVVSSKASFSPKKHLPIVIILGVLFLLFCKFMVLDRILDVTQGSNRVAELKSELTNVEQQISRMSDLEDMYAHYTVSGMTAEELGRVDRVKAMKLINKAFKGGIVSKSWNLTGNVMTLEVSGPSLSKLNELASDLESNPIVERCVISTADKNKDEKGNVVVTFIIYLQQSVQNNDGEE